MSTKIYLIKHLDNGMKYVGITDGDLASRWQQHYNDSGSAVNSALRREGHRMTMELLEEVPTRSQALRKEQEYIHKLGTAAPAGWNRKVNKMREMKPVKPKWEEMRRNLEWSDFTINQTIKCPRCGNDYTHHGDVTVYSREKEDAKMGFITHVTNGQTSTVYTEMTLNPSGRRNGIRIDFECEACHMSDDNPPPVFSWLIIQHKGNTYLEVLYYEKVA